MISNHQVTDPAPHLSGAACDPNFHDQMHTRTTRFPLLERRPDAGVLLLRIFFGVILVWGTLDNVLSQARMHEFRDFLAHNGFPYPLVSAWLSVYAQFICGVLLLVGLATRAAALVMIVNFIVAIAMVHVGLPFSANIAPLSMLALATFFALIGGGRYSLDARIFGTGVPVSPARSEVVTDRGTVGAPRGAGRAAASSDGGQIR